MIRCVLNYDLFACAWATLPWWAQWGIIACLALIVIGAAIRLYSIAKAFGGWPAAVGAIGLLGITLAALWPRKGVTTEEQYGAPPAPAPKKKRPTFFDLKKKRPF